MKLWRKRASPEPAAAANAAAGARYGSAQERLKGDAQETARQRLVIASGLFAVMFVAIALRMGYVSLLRDGAEPTQRVAARGGSIQSERADIVDRNGAVLATSVPVMSAFVNPRLLLDPQDAAKKIVSALPDLKYDDVRTKLEEDKTFVWVKRGLSPREHDRVNRLGIPGLEFQAEERRLYPQGMAAAHILGYASVDNSGLAGVERYFDQQLQSGETVQLAIDLRLQRLVEREIARAVEKFSAIGATAIVMDATNGEILAMASLPTYDPNSAKTITNEALFNRATLGVYEQGSTFKIFNTAMALDTGRVNLTTVFDATSPIKIDRFTINDDHAQRRPLNVAELFKFSSNIASAKMAVEMGSETQKAFFDKIGFLKPLNTQLTESAAPLYPRNWMKINTMTIAFGHGISVTPLHLATGSAAVINGGTLYSAEPGQAHRRQRSRASRHPGQDLGDDAPAPAAERGRGHRQERRRAGLRGRRQDRHGREAVAWRLPPKSPNQLVRWGVPDERSEVRHPRVDRRAQGHERYPWLCDGGLGGGAFGEGHHRGDGIALRHPAGRPEAGPAAHRDRIDARSGAGAAAAVRAGERAPSRCPGTA